MEKWEDNIQELIKIRKSIHGLWALNKDDHNRVDKDLLSIESRLGKAIDELKDIRKKDEEELVKIFDNFILLDWGDEQAVYNEIDKIKQRVQDHYKN